ASSALGHAKGRHLGLDLRSFGEKITVGGVGARPTTLDVINAQIIQHPRDLDLFSSRELDPLRLLTISQRGVVDEQTIVQSSASNLARSRRGPAISSTEDLLILISTPASVRADFKAST